MMLQLKKQWLTYTFILGLLLLFIFSPILFLVVVILMVHYWHKEELRANWRLTSQDSNNKRRLIMIACSLTLASLLVYQTGEYATQLGFPTTFVTYYHQLGGSFRLESLHTRLLINPLQGAINAIAYFLLLRMIEKLWRK